MKTSKIINPKIFLQGSYQFDDYYQIGSVYPIFKQTKEGSTRKTGHVGDIVRCLEHTKLWYSGGNQGSSYF